MAILKIPRFWAAMTSGQAPAPAAAATAVSGSHADGLDAFGSESEPRHAAPPADVTADSKSASVPAWLPGAAKWLAVVVLSAGVAIAGVFAYQHRFARPATGTVTLETTPAGLDVVLAGKSLGRTPLTTSLAPGTYELHVGTAPTDRTLKVVVAAGSTTIQRVEFADPVLLATAATGGLRVQTEPQHLAVSVDGVARGVSPVAIEELQPGEHEISVRTGAGPIRRTVVVKARETTSVIVSSAAPPADPAAVSAGWLSVASPIALQLREGGKIIGTSESERLMLPAGDHEIEFANEALGFTVRRTVTVTSAKTTATKIDLPNGALSINAQPWAEVWIDGERIGETPIGNLSRRIGRHDVVFRHPDFGERRETVVISVGKPARIGVDLRKK